MLKKLAKYGNSTTLVIDRAILELLNMDESSIVKLHTDGKSLIITPVVKTEDKISASPEEVTHSALGNIRTIAVKNLQNMPEEMKAKISSPPAGLEEKLKEAFARHMPIAREITKGIESNEEYAQALKALEQQFDPKTQPNEYMQGMLNLRYEFYPALAELDNEIKAITEKYS
jgi:antitoxin component of MazEF toxin-antitoxin module